MSKTFLTSVFEYKAWANQALLDVLDAAPESTNPVEMARIRITLDHTNVIDQLFKARVEGKPEPFKGVISPRTPSLAELREVMRTTDAWYVDFTRSVSPEELEEIVEFTFVDDRTRGRMSKGEMLGHVLTHANSHRGVIGATLDTLGLKAPADMVTTFLHSR
jgi:uncharacterized damage-inducible protein DinB